MLNPSACMIGTEKRVVQDEDRLDELVMPAIVAHRNKWDKPES